MEKRPVVYFSNQMEKLAEALGEELFKPGADPFAKRIVLLPHHSLKSYLSSFFANHPKWNISIAVEYKTLLEGVMTLLEGEKKGRFPSKLGISFAIEEALSQVMSEEEEQKILWIAKELSSVFYEYSIFEPKALSKWLKTSGWKQDLWSKLFSSKGKWKALVDVLPHKDHIDTPIHLFGFANLPGHFFDFFCRSKVHFYFLSPSKMFWEDLCSDKERIYLEKKMIGNRLQLHVQEQLSFLLKQTHPLLANWGRVGRDLLTRFGQMECYLEEEYVDIGGGSLLSFLQKSLLDLEDFFEKQEVSQEDTSFLCISASSKLREVEVLLDTIKELLLVSGREPKDILVFSSNLEAYVPYIHSVFGAVDCPFSYSMHGLPASIFALEAQGIEFFFFLVESRFTKKELFRFFSFPSVMEKWGFSSKDLTLLHKWVEKAHVLWGLSSEHRRDCIENIWPKEVEALPLQEEGSWAEGLERLVLGLAIDPNGIFYEEIPVQPVPVIEWVEAEVLGKFMEVISKLQEVVSAICEGEGKTLGTWISLVSKWLDTFFASSKIGDSLVRDLKALQEEVSSEHAFSFKSFKRALQSCLEAKKESFQSSHLQAVKFLPLEMGGSYPSKVIYVLGCDEESFPKKEVRSCLDETGGQRGIPSIADQSRYLLLELLVNARECLVFSYERVSSQDQKQQGPSRLLEELMGYIDLRYFFVDLLEKPSVFFTRHHPAVSFAKEYFEQNSPFTSFSTFSLAKGYYSGTKELLKPFFPSWQEEVSAKVIEKAPRIVQIRKIEDFAKNPVRFYYKEVLGIFFEFTLPEDEEFFLSPLVKSRIKKNALKHSLENGASIAGKRGEIPLGRLGAIGAQELEEELSTWKENLTHFGLQESDLFSIEFTSGVSQIKREKGRVICPPISLEVEGVGEIALEGKIYPVSSKGFLWLGKKKKEDYPLLWPSYLLFLCVAKEKELGFAEECLLLEEGKFFPIHPENPLLWLSKYMTLYFRSLQEPCPIYPKWFFTFLSKDKEEIQKKVNPSSYDTGFEDPYEQWTLQRDPPLKVELIQKKWQEQWLDVFSLFIEEDE